MCSTTVGTVDVRVSVFNSVAAQKITLTDSFGNVYCSNITGTGPSNHDFNGITFNCETALTILAEDGSCTPPPETSTPTPTQTPTATDLSSVTTYTISGCTNLTQLVIDLGPGLIIPGDVFYYEFTGETPSGCYSVVGKTIAPIDDAFTTAMGQANCNDCEASLVTPTPTNTETPTNTPTPSSVP